MQEGTRQGSNRSKQQQLAAETQSTYGSIHWNRPWKKNGQIGRVKWPDWSCSRECLWTSICCIFTRCLLGPLHCQSIMPTSDICATLPSDRRDIIHIETSIKLQIAEWHRYEGKSAICSSIPSSHSVTSSVYHFLQEARILCFWNA